MGDHRHPGPSQVVNALWVYPRERNLRDGSQGLLGLFIVVAGRLLGSAHTNSLLNIALRDPMVA